MKVCTRVVFVVVLLSLLASHATADSSLRLEAGATTARTDALASTPGFTLGGAVALTRWAPRARVAFVPQLELLFAHRNASALVEGAEPRAPTLDVLELPLVLRGELTHGSRTFHVLGGAYGSVVLRAQTRDDRGGVERADTSSPVEVGWVAGGGLTLASLASGELSIEMRYQRPSLSFMLEGDGRPATLSLLLGYGLRSGSREPLSARSPGPSLALKGGLVATRLQPAGLASKSAPSDYRPGFAFGGLYSPLRFGSQMALLPQVELSFVRRNAAETGPADSSLAMDSIDLAMLARGELVASGHTYYGTFYGIGGLYGSLLLDAQRSHDGRITDMSGTISSVDAGWILGGGIELSSLATVKPAIELRYQRGFRNLVPAGPGEVNQQTVSCLVSITYGGSSPAAPHASVPDALYSSHDDGATTTPSPSTRRVTSVVVGRPGDRWLDTMRFTRIERATRDGAHGYGVSYDIAGHGPVVLFWPRDRIDFDGRSPGSRLESMKLREGRLWYPQRITSRTLPRVCQGILQLEEDYAKQADGANSAMAAFAIVASLGGLQPTLRATAGSPPRSTTPRASNRAVSPAPTGPAARGSQTFGPKSLGAAERLLNLGDGVRVGAATFHSGIKPAILKAAGKFAEKVGKNPDIKVVGGKIHLQGVGPFKGKTFKTDLRASDFFDLN